MLRPDSEIEIGYEVCFDRDYWDCFREGHSPYSPKRTFDLCVFLPQDIIIIEAKVHEGFTNKQMGEFVSDIEAVKALVRETTGTNNLGVHLIGLAHTLVLDGLSSDNQAAVLKSMPDLG